MKKNPVAARRTGEKKTKRQIGKSHFLTLFPKFENVQRSFSAPGRLETVFVKANQNISLSIPRAQSAHSS